ncbi:MAG: hypothetical protein K6F37_06245 [Lachnospiraceae bacterium]|nr:hypothetical protein [Lachnospiraceae bacterium]
MSKEVEGQLSLFDSVDDLMAELKKKAATKKIDKEIKSAVEETQTIVEDLNDLPIADEKESLPKRRKTGSLTEGESIENKFSREKYTVIKDMGNYAYVRASDNTVHEMLKSDMLPV